MISCLDWEMFNLVIQPITRTGLMLSLLNVVILQDRHVR